MSKIIYVRIDYSTTLENLPSDFGSTLKYSNYDLHHDFSSGMSGGFPKYFAVAGDYVGDTDYVTYKIVSAQYNKPADYYTKWTGDGKTAAWWEVNVPDDFQITNEGSGGNGGNSDPILSAGPLWIAPEPSKIIEGNNRAQTINGTDDHELVNGRGGKDQLYLGAGNDYAHGGKGNDKVYGGLGDDNISGNSGHDYLYGQDGDDFLFGDRGHDKAYGGSGNDLLSGYLGADRLNGGVGNDKLLGGKGKDVLIGGEGNDVFYMLVAPGKPNADKILDFTQGEDQIQLSKGWYVSDTSRIHFDASTGEIFYDKHGYDNQDDYRLIATIKPNIYLTTADLVFV